MDTLVLSNAYEPIDRIPWRRAVTLWFLDKVEILEEYTDREVRSVGFAMKVPAVIRFLASVVWRRRGVRFSRENVYTRDNGRCAYCCKPVSRSDATWDHVVPRAAGGTTRWENVVIACLGCNQQKGARTPEQAGMKLRARPVKPRSSPASFRLAFGAKDVPETWRGYLRDVIYWHGALETDGD